MKLRTLIIDDEPIALEKLRNYVVKIPFLELAAVCDSPTDAVELLAKDSIDLIITDIEMPDINGMELVRSLVHPPFIIFTTAYADYAVESYKLPTVDYLLKPYSFTDLQRAANRAYDNFKLRQEQHAATSDSIFVKVENRHIRVSLNEIRYIKGYGEYLQIFVDDLSKPLMTISSFASLLERLPGNFLQIHRSFVVNMNKISHIERNRVAIDSETFLPVSDTYLPSFRQYLQRLSVGPK